ncbi:MAG: alanine--tRNA ligase, partial [Thermodesulfobacteriota bacterium]
EEAVVLSWECLTKELGIPQDRLWVTVYKEDDEAFQLWHKLISLPSQRIVKMGKEDNFWAMGESGPCGPCSEIVVDLGPSVGCRRPGCRVGCDCNRFLELWNLVFMQYNRDENGQLTDLPRPSIDTGMGLERLAAVLQGVNSNYRTDLFIPLLELVEDISGKEYGVNESWDVSMQVIADHSRALAFLIAEGLLPENEGRGYVLRRILRRASRHGRQLDIREPFLYRTALAVVDLMSSAYSELKARPDHLAWVIQGEEERFSLTLDQGLRLLADEIRKLKSAGASVIPGEIIFKLYDTFGFPTDLTQDVAREEGMELDLAGFDAAMGVQKERARRKDFHVTPGAGSLGIIGHPPVVFVGHHQTSAESEVVKIISQGREEVAVAATPEEVYIITDSTPFYGEAGGQVGDVGVIEGRDSQGEVVDTIRPYGEVIAHQVRMKKGAIRLGDKVALKVDEAKRRATAANHTATHLLHTALRRVLGTHVKQSGSLVARDRLRFDFSHYTRLNETEIRLIEDLVNEMIWENVPLVTEVLSFEEALKTGALAFFGEKYGEKVRVVRIGDYSQELCGGIHCQRTGDVALFKIVSEGAVSAGVRRLEALTGPGALAYARNLEGGIKELADLLRSTADPDGVKAKVRGLLDRNASLEKEIARLSNLIAAQEVDRLLAGVREVGGVKLLTARVVAKDFKELRQYGDKIKERLKSGVLLLGTEVNGQALLLAMVTKDLASRLDASRLVQSAAAEMGGSGGGRREMAQAGGGRPGKISAAFSKVIEILGGHSDGS